MSQAANLAALGTNAGTTGVLTSAGLPTGCILQVVQSVVTAGFSSSSGSFVTTGLTANITPKFSTSKVLVIAAMQTAQQASNQPVTETIYRNSTNLGNASSGFAGTYSAAGGYTVSTNSIVYLDSPATTASTTYTLYAKSDTGSAFNIGGGNQPITLTLMEVAA